MYRMGARSCRKKWWVLFVGMVAMKRVAEAGYLVVEVVIAQEIDGCRNNSEKGEEGDKASGSQHNAYMAGGLRDCSHPNCLKSEVAILLSELTHVCAQMEWVLW